MLGRRRFCVYSLPRKFKSDRKTLSRLESGSCPLDVAFLPGELEA